ncbi:RNA helicase Mov10l1 [Nothobranchius furzeri]|uniref:RNA helicase n=3 Tax=Nothobranchius TaxID=28779 RepID=A0A8C6Q6C4_NOTFU|nr:RNA helicase Mov10l1 [Nothobranchius furzeri]KAF7224131.1 Mov10 RISC complex RNA helicase like 1 [Nothobranchius furzeri]
MLASMRWLLSKLVSPLWRTVDDVDVDILPDSSCYEDVRHLRGSVVTELCLDYGLIDDSIFFTSTEVLGGIALKQGDLVNCIAVRGGTKGGWKALRVEKSADAWDDGGRTSIEADSLQLRPLIGAITSVEGDGGYISQTTYFSRQTLLEGYEPMKGDWVQVQYFINPGQWTTQAHSVAPLRYSRLDQVSVTSVYGGSGVVEDSVFFSLSSLLLPTNYQPSVGDLVNLVMVESSQSLYSWRALCMAPCSQSCSRNVSAVPVTDAELPRVLENKGGLDVSDYGQFGDVMLGEQNQLVFWIQNKGSEMHTLKSCEFAGWDSEEQFNLITVNNSSPSLSQRQHSQENGSEPLETQGRATLEADKENDAVQTNSILTRRAEKEVNLAPGERHSIVIVVQAKILGSCRELLLLHFSSFTIGRLLEVTVGCEDENLLQPSVPFSPLHNPQSTNSSLHVVTVSAPKDAPRLTRRKLPNFLPTYAVPKRLRDCVEMQGDVLAAQPCLGEVLSPFNMQSRFSALLWLEELHAERELREFMICGALLRKGAAYLHLKVLGLAEGRPNLNIGDRVLLKKPECNGVMLEYISYVTEINDEDVSLRVNSDFQRNYVGEPLDVEFTYNRLTMRRCHFALEQTRHFWEILFPSRVTLQTPQWSGKWLEESQETENGPVSDSSANMESRATQTKDGELTTKPIPSQGQFFNPDLNCSQKEAVKRILAGECRPMPYVLFGPPGTGKTVTLLETILQVYHFLPSSRVLVCTPSNSAADLICIRLHYSGFLHTASLARINASGRDQESIPEVLQPYSRAGEDIRQAAFHRIVVSTCSSAGMFHNVGIQVGHFSHVFLDEAGQATEPESLIPISLVSERDGQIVLAGDPCQLGPVVKSHLASSFGLGVSLLERLMSNPLYSKHDWGYNPKLVTKLIYNYRSHEALLTLPSKLFYLGELCFKASRDVVESLCQWKTLPKKGFPLLFHGIRGTEFREGNNPSRFNPSEAVQAMLYCCQLAKKIYKPVSSSDIGIIAPYRKQSEKIRMLLAKVGLSDIKVGSVEEFQGQEFLVIILSTVRSDESVESDDLQSSLGFLANPKRFNVAITRPKALLLIVGNPHVLIRDPCFRALLQYSFINGAYLGCDPPPSLRNTQIAAEEQKPA